MVEMLEIIIKKHGQDQIFRDIDSQLQEVTSLKNLILIILKFTFCLSVMIAEELLRNKAQLIENKENLLCPKCNRPLESKGFSNRCIRTIIGLIKWRRRIWRCPYGCNIKQIVPFDEELGIKPNQKISNELKQMACLLAVFLPYQIASTVMTAITGIKISHTTIFNWVQCIGAQAKLNIENELKALSENKLPDKAEIPEKIVDLLMAIGGDGVMVPFRQNGGSPEGKIQWREVKIGIFARLCEKYTKKGEKVKVIVRKRVVAVLGTIDEFKVRMKLMAIKEGINDAKKVIWLSDGGSGYWGVFHDLFSKHAQGILDFFHGVQYVWKGAKAWLDGRTNKSHEWFAIARRKIRNGEVKAVVFELKETLSKNEFPEETDKVLRNLVVYLETHLDHMNYDIFKAMGFPIGSGMVESTCKWLIQQRFKGVGMRWSEDGFNNLLHLRLAWANDIFEDLFIEHASPNS